MGARFISLAISGFKSFADSTTVAILPGLTGIVGPNGCGKSNVAEALKWAMGEANPRHLRGGEMDDVIFAGTANRPSRNLAEVSLTVEEDGAGLPAPFSDQRELQIVRRIDRGTGSSYRVNGREARARDVQTLFADLASGARSSAMVSQGRVGTLVNARPEERRAVLEDAAGITGLHSRRAEAETRLRATEANLQRAEERRALLVRQMEGLSGQARQAERYRTVVSALQETEASLWAIQRGRARMAKDSAAAAVAEADERLKKSQATAADAAEAAERQQATLPGIRAAENEAAATLERAKIAADRLTTDLSRAEAAVAAGEARKEQQARDLSYAEATLNDAEVVDARLAAEAKHLMLEAEQYPMLLLAAQGEASEAAVALQAADHAASDAAAQASVASAQTYAAQQLVLQAEARHRRATEAMTRLTAECSAAEDRLVHQQRLGNAAAELAAAEEALVDATSACACAEQDYVDARRTTSVARASFSAQDTLRHRVAAETAALAEILATKDGEQWPQLIDSLSVPVGLETALGAALGEELAAAADPDASRHWRMLPKLVPVPIPGRRLADQVLGPPLLARALQAIGLVQSDAEGALAQAELSPGQCVVSMSGAIWRWDGYTVRGGTPTVATVRLEQRNKLMQLRQQLDLATTAADLGEGILANALRVESEATARLDHHRQAQRDAESAANRARSAAETLRLQAEAAQSRLGALREQLMQTTPELHASTEALRLAREAVESQPNAAVLRAIADQARLAVSSARQRDIVASRAVESLQRLEQARQSRIVTIGRERDDRRMQASELGGRVADLRARAKEATDELAGLARLPGLILEGTIAAREHLAQCEAARAQTVADREAAEAQSSALALLARTREQSSYTARETLLRAENALLVAEQALAAVLAQTADRETSLPTLQSLPELSAQAEDRAKARISRLLKERDEIGPVNLRADIEAGILEHEITTIIRERDELETAVAKLRGSIGNINREGRERLSTVFQQVDRHFQSLFNRMFGGGRAHLALVGSDDPLLAGLEIYAQPPGKRLSALSLLSGGEQALTALSLIFAVFRCNPAPLCILDEVDAPLDDANVGRFCALLNDVVQETGTRFLVVTHHQVTMAAMDRLYGVTMQERGISRLLSVDLSRAVDMIEAVAAE